MLEEEKRTFPMRVAREPSVWSSRSARMAVSRTLWERRRENARVSEGGVKRVDVHEATVNGIFEAYSTVCDW